MGSLTCTFFLMLHTPLRSSPAENKNHIKSFDRCWPITKCLSTGRKLKKYTKFGNIRCFYLVNLRLQALYLVERNQIRLHLHSTSSKDHSWFWHVQNTKTCWVGDHLLEKKHIIWKNTQKSMKVRKDNHYLLYFRRCFSLNLPDRKTSFLLHAVIVTGFDLTPPWQSRCRCCSAFSDSGLWGYHRGRLSSGEKITVQLPHPNNRTHGLNNKRDGSRWTYIYTTPPQSEGKCDIHHDNTVTGCDLTSGERTQECGVLHFFRPQNVIAVAICQGNALNPSKAKPGNARRKRKATARLCRETSWLAPKATTRTRDVRLNMHHLKEDFTQINIKRRPVRGRQLRILHSIIRLWLVANVMSISVQVVQVRFPICPERPIFVYCLFLVRCRYFPSAWS